MSGILASSWPSRKDGFVFPVEVMPASHHVHMAGYDAGEKELHVWFKNGSHYVYEGVSPIEWHQLMGGNYGTFGVYLNAVIIQRHQAVKVS